MGKKKRSLVKHQNPTAVCNSSNSDIFAAWDSDHSIDCPSEPSAYGVFLFKKNGANGTKSKANEQTTIEPILVDCVEDGKTCRDFMKEDRNVLASKIHSKNVDESVKEMEKMYSTEKEHKIMKESTGKGNNRKRKSVEKKESNGSPKMQKLTNSDTSVFSCLFKKADNLKEIEALLEQEMSDIVLPNFERKRTSKLQKKKQKIIRDGNIVSYSSKVKATVENGKGQEIEKNGVNSGDEMFYETNGIEEEGTVNGNVSDNLTFCGTDEDVNAYNVVIDFEKKPFSVHGDSVRNGLDALQWLIYPYDTSEFLKTVFQREVFYASHNNASYYGNLFSTEKFIDILRRDYVEYGTNVNVAVYKNQQRSTLNGSGKVYPREIQNSIKSGCSVQFTNPQSFCDNVWYYCDLLQEVFGCFVGANTYITPANTAGFAPHWDDIDAFLLQLEGRKHWKIYAPIDENEQLPRISSGNFTDDDVADRILVFDDWLEQGDMLYIPRGFIHQGFADKDVHSLHLTVSVCRNVTYADLLERIIPPALSNFAEQHVNIRKSLAVGYLDMTGVLECDYPLFKTGGVKLNRFLDVIFSNFCKYIKELNEPAVDMMAREFMRTALPPVFTKEEKDMTALCLARSSLYGGKKHVFTNYTSIKLLRRHGQRLIYESEERCFIVHRIANSRVYEGRAEALFDLDVELAKGFANLLNSYPQWCSVSDLKCNTAADSIRLAELLYSNGLLMAKFAESVE